MLFSENSKIRLIFALSVHKRGWSLKQLILLVKGKIIRQVSRGLYSNNNILIILAFWHMSVGKICKKQIIYFVKGRRNEIKRNTAYDTKVIEKKCIKVTIALSLNLSICPQIIYPSVFDLRTVVIRDRQEQRTQISGWCIILNSVWLYENFTSGWLKWLQFDECI
jgi:hypothetical protein